VRYTGVGTQRLDFAEFYRESKDACLFSVLVSVGDRDRAQDLVDEAFARAWASWRLVSRHPAPVSGRAVFRCQPAGCSAHREIAVNRNPDCNCWRDRLRWRAALPAGRL